MTTTKEGTQDGAISTEDMCCYSTKLIGDHELHQSGFQLLVRSTARSATCPECVCGHVCVSVCVCECLCGAVCVCVALISLSPRPGMFSEGLRNSSVSPGL